MDASANLQVVEDVRYQLHVGPDEHPERPERLLAVHRALAHYRDRFTLAPSRPAELDELLRVHDAAHLATLDEFAGRSGRLDADTFVSPHSVDVARLAAGSVIDLSKRVARGEAKFGLAAVRPPGHHAEGDRAMGFCLLNNVAIAARALQADEGVGKILIFDWDVHHGNGTQHTFDEDPSVLYASTHQFPYYPGTGDAAETGRGAGAGTTLNIPLPAGCGDAEYIGSVQRLLLPVARAFQPDLIMISCGFDAHRDDPLASMQVSEQGYRTLTALLRSLADEVCDGRLMMVLEGGYSTLGLQEGIGAVVETLLLEDASPLVPPLAGLTAGTTLRSVVDRVAAEHRGRVPNVGSG
jgi:acetoin utilization deacetylase AcuC-like enzyme